MKIVIDIEKELYKYIRNHYTGKDTSYLAIKDGLVLPDNILTIKERPKGKWATVEGNYFTPGGDVVLICPFCESEESKHSGGVEFPVHWNFCPFCGADMRGVKEK